MTPKLPERPDLNSPGANAAMRDSFLALYDAVEYLLEKDRIEAKSKRDHFTIQTTVRTPKEPEPAKNANTIDGWTPIADGSKYWCPPGKPAVKIDQVPNNIIEQHKKLQKGQGEQ